VATLQIDSMGIEAACTLTRLPDNIFAIAGKFRWILQQSSQLPSGSVTATATQAATHADTATATHAVTPAITGIAIHAATATATHAVTHAATNATPTTSATASVKDMIELHKQPDTAYTCAYRDPAVVTAAVQSLSQGERWRDIAA